MSASGLVQSAAVNRSESRQRTALANVRLRPEEHEELQRLAAEEGLSIGEVIRQALIATRAIRVHRAV